MNKKGCGEIFYYDFFHNKNYCCGDKVIDGTIILCKDCGGGNE